MTFKLIGETEYQMGNDELVRAIDRTFSHLKSKTLDEADKNVLRKHARALLKVQIGRAALLNMKTIEGKQIDDAESGV